MIGISLDGFCAAQSLGACPDRRPVHAPLASKARRAAQQGSQPTIVLVSKSGYSVSKKR
jgi:hypothetical protein